MMQDLERDGKREKKNLYRRRFFVKMAVLAAVILLLLTQVICIRRSGGNEMFPAICEGDLVIAYRLSSPSPGDAVLYRDAEGNVKLGRIAAGPGMRVELDEDAYRIDGSVPDEKVFYPTKPAEKGIEFPVTVPEKEYFILNDFRPQMDDARTEGCTPERRILGKVIFIMRRRGI